MTANSKKIDIGYWDTQKKLVSSNKEILERLLKSLGAISLEYCESLDAPELLRCRIIVTSALMIEPQQFLPWFYGLEKRVATSSLLYIPLIILADLSQATSKTLLEHSLQSSWYFDIIGMNQIDTLPLRVANMLRIHDHLNELMGFRSQLAELQTQVAELEGQLKSMKLK